MISRSAGVVLPRRELIELDSLRSGTGKGRRDRQTKSL